MLPQPFLGLNSGAVDLIRGHAAKAVLDLAAGAGNFAKAALLERVPYYAFTLTECHSKKLEVILTQFLVDEMRREGSTHFRPEAVQDQERQEADSVELPKNAQREVKRTKALKWCPKRKQRLRPKTKKTTTTKKKRKSKGPRKKRQVVLPW